MKIALYAGSFDPITNGHIDIIERACGVFDEVIIAISHNYQKKYLFSMEERIMLTRQALNHLNNIKVIEHTGGMTVAVAKQLGASVLIRGVRNTVDFEFEAGVAAHNKRQDPSIETMLFVCDEKFRFVSSSMVKELALFGGKFDYFVPANVVRALEMKYLTSPERQVNVRTVDQ